MSWDKHKNKANEGGKGKKYGRAPVQGKLSAELFSLEERRFGGRDSYNEEDRQESNGHSLLE